MRTNSFCLLALMAVLLVSVRPAQAQWQTQSFVIKPGWTAIYLHVDPSYTNLDYLIGSDPNNPIDQILLWIPAGTVQYVSSPQNALTASSGWAKWQRLSTSTPNSLANLIPNAAYLVHSTAASHQNYNWNVKGRPVAPNYIWQASGLNLVDFPTVTNNPPLLDNFLSVAPGFQNNIIDIYQYLGGDLGPTNPSPVWNPHGTQVTRGTAFWLRSGTYFNTYFGPFTVGIVGGLEFSNLSSTLSFHLKNTTPNPVTVTLNLAPSETSPAGQKPILGLPPLLVRGVLGTNLTYAASNLTTANSLSWNLAPNTSTNGADIVVVLGVNRASFAGNPTDLYAGILRFTDANNFTEVDVPVSASPNSYAGLWVGAAAVSQVANYLKIYQRDATNGLVIGTNGAYVVAGVNNALTNTASSFPLRLILHNNGTNVVLMQRVFFGSDVYSNSILTTSQSKLDPTQLGSARRLSAVQLPWIVNSHTWPFSGQLIPGGTLTTSVELPYDDQANNPFLHTYHPDHDNLDASFKLEALVGSESYGVTRQITLSFGSVGGDFDSLTQFGQSFSGNYSEAIIMTGIMTGNGPFARTNIVAGNFSINRISTIATLTLP